MSQKIQLHNKKKNIDELKDYNNTLEKNLEEKENEITKIINENKNLKDQIKQLKNNAENNFNDSKKQETIIYKKEIISNRPSAVEIKETVTVNKSNRPSRSQIETQKLNNEILNVNKNISNIIDKINNSESERNIKEKKNNQSEVNTSNNYQIKNPTKEEKDKRIMQRINNQRKIQSAQKDDKNLNPASNFISNMAKELENVLRNKPNPNNNSKTETVVIVNEDIINTIENKDASQTKRKKAKKFFNADDE